jgi:hypothetical protein
LPATDATGASAPQTAVSLNPIISPYNRNSQTIGGTIQAGQTLTVTLNNTPVAATVSGTAWSATLAGMAEGDNAIVVNAIDATNVATRITATITVDTVPPALTISPVTTPSTLDTQTLSGTIEAGISPVITVDTAASIGPITVNGSSWSARISGLKPGVNNIKVSAVDLAGNSSTSSVAITFSGVPPVVTFDTIPARSRKTDQTVSGTVSAGATPVMVVSVGNGALAGQVTVSGSQWSCRIFGLQPGNNTLTVTATDAQGNTTSTKTVVTVVIGDGCFRGTGSPDISDALKALRMAVGIITPTADDLLHGDVNLDNKIDSGDALLILRKVTGLTSF